MTKFIGRVKSQERKRNDEEMKENTANVDREKIKFTITFIDANGQKQQETVTGITSLNIRINALSQSNCTHINSTENKS